MDISQESLEFENAKLKFEKADLELNGTVLMLDKACSMYNYVKQYGVDKAFVRMHNEHSELDAMANMVYPGLESFFSYPSDIAKYEQACMEGIMSGIKSAIDWVLKKLKQLGAFIADLVRKFINLFRHTEEDTKKEAALLAAAAENMSPGEEVKVEENSDSIIKTADKLNEKVQDIMADDKKLQEVKDYMDKLENETMQRIKSHPSPITMEWNIFKDWVGIMNSAEDHTDLPNKLKEVCDEIAGSLEKLGKRTITFRNKSDVIKFIDKGQISADAAQRMCDILDKSDKELHKLIDYYTKKLEEYKESNSMSKPLINYATQCIRYMEFIAKRNMKIRNVIILSFKSTGHAYREVRRAIEQTDNATRRMKIKTQ